MMTLKTLRTRLGLWLYAAIVPKEVQRERVEIIFNRAYDTGKNHGIEIGLIRAEIARLKSELSTRQNLPS